MREAKAVGLFTVSLAVIILKRGPRGFVVLHPLGFIRQNPVSFHHFLKLIGGSLIVRVAVGMIPENELPISALDLVRICFSFNTQEGIVVDCVFQWVYP